MRIDGFYRLCQEFLITLNGYHHLQKYFRNDLRAILPDEAFLKILNGVVLP